jgi:hypothetical protein
MGNGGLEMDGFRAVVQTAARENGQEQRRETFHSVRSRADSPYGNGA